jgi:hypothetical protein
MEPLDPDASPWDRRVAPCAVHDWGKVGACPNRVAPAQGPSSSSHQGEGREEEADERHIKVVTDPVGAPTIHRTTHISIGLRGRPQGPLVHRTEPSPPPSPTSLTLIAPPPALPSTEAGPSDSGMSPDLLSSCGNRVLWQFARFITPIWQRPCARVLGLDDQGKALSGGNGRRGAAPREMEEQERFSTGGATR